MESRRLILRFCLPRTAPSFSIPLLLFLLFPLPPLLFACLLAALSRPCSATRHTGVKKGSEKAKSATALDLLRLTVNVVLT